MDIEDLEWKTKNWELKLEDWNLRIGNWNVEYLQTWKVDKLKSFNCIYLRDAITVIKDWNSKSEEILTFASTEIKIKTSN